MQSEQRLNELFQKHLEGNCTEEEWKELLYMISLIKEDDVDDLSAPMLALWQKATNKELPSTAHILNREQMMADIMEAEAPSAPVRRLYWWRVAAAAVLLGVIATSIYLLFPTREPGTPEIVQEQNAEQIQPGYDRAVLTLADGRTIVLDSAVNGTLLSEGGTTVLNFDGQLAYETGKELRPEDVTQNTVTTGRASQYQLILPDGSKVWLNAVSSIRFPTAFVEGKREVYITGEAYFEVERNEEQPFLVHFSTGADDGREGVVEVLGTEFNINAYNDEAEVKTTLLEGSVRIWQEGKTENAIMLSPGQEANLNASTFQKAAGDVELAIAWKNGYFQFNRASLPVLMRQIGRWYDVDIRFEGAIPEKMFRGKIQRSLPLSSILNLLTKGGMEFELKGRVLVVKT